jgi:hypothetical protein
VFFASGPRSRFSGLGLVGAGLCRAARFAPLPVVLVPPEHFLQDGVDDVVGVALDETSVVFEELNDWLFEFDFPSDDRWCFLNDRHVVPPWVMDVSFKLPVTVEKTRGTMNRAGGRERPHELFGRLKAEKVGSLPPDLVFFPR